MPYGQQRDMLENHSYWTISSQVREERFRDLKETIEQHNKDIVHGCIEIYGTVAYTVGFQDRTIPCPRMFVLPCRMGG